MQSFIFNNIIPENVSIVQEYLVSFSEQARNLGIPSVILLAAMAVLMLTTIERTFNEIWRVSEPRHGFQRFLMYWAVLTLSAPFLGVSLATTGYLESLPFISVVTETTGILHLVPILLTATLFTLVYMIVPGCRVPVKHAAAGGVIIAVAFEVAKNLFVSIMSQSSFEAIYGTFAAVPLFLLWIYVSWTIILMGAEFVKSLGIYRFAGGYELEESLFQVVYILKLFHEAHQAGNVISDYDLRNHVRRIDLEQWPEIRSKLIEMNIIRVVAEGNLVLSKDLKKVSVWDLYKAFPWQLPREVRGNKDWERKLSERFNVLYRDGEAKLGGDLESLFEVTQSEELTQEQTQELTQEPAQEPAQEPTQETFDKKAEHEEDLSTDNYARQTTPQPK